MKKTLNQFVINDLYHFYKRCEERWRYKKSLFPHQLFERERLEYQLSKLEDKLYSCIGTLNCTAYISKEPKPFEDRLKGKERQLVIGDKWAELVFDCAWMQIQGEIPQYDDKQELVFLVNVGGEGLVCDKNGVEKQGITCYASDYDYTLGLPIKQVVVAEGLYQGSKVDFWIDAAANDLFGKTKGQSKLQRLEIAVINKETRALYYDLQVLLSAYDYSNEADRNKQLLRDVKRALKNPSHVTEESAKNHRAVLARYLTEMNHEVTFEYSAIGHAHLDLAWLWPIRESKRKGARTFASQILNISRYPNYVFGASQAQLFSWLKDDYPMLYEKLKELAKGKNFEVQGATWVEMDSNLIGGESLIRQFFYGKQFFRDEFNQEMKILWLPDSFGYSPCLPQVMKLAGVPYFLTQKMSWNTVNKFPYHTFWWEGLDGSTALAHMLPESTYNSPVTAQKMTFGVRNYQEKAISHQAMMLFGIGDGGGGPGFEHIERAERLKDIKGLPKVKMEKSVELLEKLDDGETKYPLHRGELYLERHQGTYTTQSKNKWYNRKMEFALRNVELLTAIALALEIPIPMSKDRIEEIWKEVLLYQFHDILPGSSIDRVYSESVEKYGVLLNEVECAIGQLAETIFGSSCYMNLNAFDIEQLIEKDGDWFWLKVPQVGAASIDSNKRITEFYAQASNDAIENDRIRIVFREGVIISLYDKTLCREFAVKADPMAVFSQYKDVGDAWDIRPVRYQNSQKKAVLKCFSIQTSGAMAFADVEFVLGKSTIKQRVSIVDGSNLVTIDIDVDCSQSSSMMRVAFPTTIYSDQCSFNVQFGHITRSTKESTSFEKAQYEVSGQKFVDLSSEAWGISLINDGKYGYRAKNNVIDVNLIRSPKKGPGSHIDQGHHHIKLALYTHAGSLSSDTYEQAYRLNNPLIHVKGENPSPNYNAFIENSNSAIILEGVKVAEDGQGMILHLYNCENKENSTEITLVGRTPKTLVDVMENTICDMDSGLLFNPFELKCVKFLF